jgi:hypothetical protein
MLDEPVAGMNREETEDMARFILDVRAEWGVTVLMVEHDMGMVMDLSDHVVVLNFGQVIAQGTPAVVQADPEVNRAYLGAGDVGDLRRCAARGQRPPAQPPWRRSCDGLGLSVSRSPSRAWPAAACTRWPRWPSWWSTRPRAWSTSPSASCSWWAPTCSSPSRP